MKALLIAASFLPRIGGREKYQDMVMAEFAPDEAVVLTPDREGDYAVFDANYRLKVLRCNRMELNWFYAGRCAKARWFAELGWLCLREGVDVVLCETVFPDGMSGWLLNRALGLPYVVFVTGPELGEGAANDWTRARLAKVLACAEKMIACGGFMKHCLIEQGVSSDKVSIVEPGIDPAFLVPDDGHAESIRERYDLRGKKVILTLARLDERKGHDKVIEAMPFVLDAVPDAIYLIVGDGTERTHLKTLARTLGVDQRVIFAGAVPDDEVPSFYSAADVFTMPNREIRRGESRGGLDYEGFGIVFLEANARGLPVIGGRSGGALDAVVDGESGYLVNPLDEKEIARRLIQLLSDPILAKRLGENGRRRVETHFSWDRAARQVRSLVLDVATAHSPAPLHWKAWHSVSTLLQPEHRFLNG